MPPKPAAYFVTSPDRIGHAVLVGGTLAGLVAVPLAAAAQSVADVVTTWAILSLLAALGITAIALPMWYVLHCRGLRSPGAAATTGALIAMFATLALLGIARWPIALPLALAGAGVALAMQAVAYRRLM